MEKDWKPEGCELLIEGGEEGERRAKQGEGEEPQQATVGLGYQAARQQLDDPRPPGRETGNGTHSRLPCLVGQHPRKNCAGVCRVTLQLGHRAVPFLCGQGRHVLA